MPIDGSSPDINNLEFPPEYPPNLDGKRGRETERTIHGLLAQRNYRQQQQETAAARTEDTKRKAQATIITPTHLRATRLDNNRFTPVTLTYTTDAEFEAEFPTRPSAPVIETSPPKKNWIQRLFRL